LIVVSGSAFNERRRRMDFRSADCGLQPAGLDWNSAVVRRFGGCGADLQPIGAE
jgi:hypothetical protein